MDNFFIIPLGGIKNKRSFIYIKNLCYGINKIIREELKGEFLLCDDQSISTTKLVSLLARNSKRRKYIIKIPFFKSLLAYYKPGLFSKLCTDLVIDNKTTRETLNIENPYSLEDAIKDIT